MKIKTLILLALLLPELQAQDRIVSYLYDETTQAPDKIIEVTHLNAELKIIPQKKYLEGKAEYSFTTLRTETDSIIFDTYGMTFNSISVDGKAAKFSSMDRITVIYPPFKLGYKQVHKITFVYVSSPVPPSGMYFTGWDDERNIMRKQVWAHRPFGWLPYIDCRLTADLFITFDSKYKVFANGERISVRENSDGTKTWNYRMTKEHPFFSTCLTAGDYEIKTSSTKNGIPLEFCYYPGLENNIEPTYRYTEYMFEFFEKEFGYPYPYPIYRELPAVDYLYGAMETTTSTVYGDFMLVDQRGYFGRNFINTNAHELAHQWFGNYLGHLRGKDVWLTESFATYFGKIFEKDIFGEDYYQNERNNEMVRAFNAAGKDNYPVGHYKGGTDRFYPKGSLVLDMMRYVIGDEEFKSSIKHYLEVNESKVVETSDFLKAIRESTGWSLEWFFNEWIYRGGEPHYKVSYNKRESETIISVSQIQDTSEVIKLFKMPVNIEVYYTDGSFDAGKFWIEKRDEEIIIPDKGKKSVSYIIFDPGRNILKNLTFNRSFEELSAQALNSKNMIDRYDAILAIKNIPVEKKRDVLVKCYGKENFHLIKSEIISQLSEDRTPTGIKLFKDAISDSDAQVRKAILKSLLIVPTELLPDYEQLLKDSAYFNVEYALENLCASYPENIQKYLDITKNEIGWRGRNIRIKWLEIAIASNNELISQNKQKPYLDEMIDLTGNSYDFETRINAINTLKRFNYLNEKIIKNLFNSVLYWNWKLSNTARTVIEYYNLQGIYRENLLNFYRTNIWNEKEKKILESILNKQ